MSYTDGFGGHMLGERDPYLDLLRALAITSVLIFHVTQMWPVSQPWLVPYTNYGALGVDLFFVLSGWLIGGLYWREIYLKGSVNLLIFWSRRWFRTIPPYLVGLLFSWGAVAFKRSEPFDFGYLLFFQNYYERIPFFLVSWSLCVEEHFYFFIPLLFFLLISIGMKSTGILLVILITSLLIARAVEYENYTPIFGYYLTATHLRADGLLLGFLAAYLVYWKQYELTVGRRIIFGIIAIISFGIFIIDITPRLTYIFKSFFVALGFLGFLLIGVGLPQIKKVIPTPVKWLALISYAVYLTHALVVHVCLQIFSGMVGTIAPVYFVLEVGTIFLTGWIFYRLVELPSMRLREYLFPSRALVVLK